MIFFPWKMDIFYVMKVNGVPDQSKLSGTQISTEVQWRGPGTYGRADMSSEGGCEIGNASYH